MESSPDDSALAALDGPSLRVELARSDWKNDPLFVRDEQIFRLFRRAMAAGDTDRGGLLGRELGRRMLHRAKAFAFRSGIYQSFNSPDEAAEELSQYVWTRLFEQPKDAAHAEKYFGQLFLRRALDFQRRLLAKKRSFQERFEEEMAHTDDDEMEDDHTASVAREIFGHVNAQEGKQHAAEAAAKLQNILTKEEHSTFVMLFVEDMKVKEVAAALGVTSRSINNYKNGALRKIRKEFQNEFN